MSSIADIHVFGVIGGYCSCCTFDMRIVRVAACSREHLITRLMTERGILTTILTSGSFSIRFPDSKDTSGCKCTGRLGFIENDPSTTCTFSEIEEEFMSFTGDVLDYKPFADYYGDHDILNELESEPDDSSEGFYAIYFGAGEEAYANMCKQYGSSEIVDKMMRGEYRGEDGENESHVEHAVYTF